MQKLSVVDPEYPCAQHLDDMSHVLVGETESELKHKLVKAGTIVGQEVKRLHLTLAAQKQNDASCCRNIESTGDPHPSSGHV